jgi:protein gp37
MKMSSPYALGVTRAEKEGFVVAEKTNIAWSNATWNPWHGCAKVSAGCKNCYMFREKKQYGQDPTLVVRSKTKFSDPLRWVARGKAPRYCFTCSWSDFFIEQADPWRAEAWDIIQQTPEITYQILTKRPERISMGLPDDWREGYPNVWLGVSVENREAKHRIETLREIPAALRFLSLEPLLQHLGDIDLSGVGWLIAGGESGPGARPMHPGWARSLRDQCLERGLPFFFKQWGEWTPGENVDRTSGTVQTATWTDGRTRWLFNNENLARNDGHRDDEPNLYRIGTKAAGATLDGREWHEFPA